MSPSASWAKWVMPTRTEPSVSPGVRTHSCSVVYFRSSGYTGTPHVPRSASWSGRTYPLIGRFGRTLGAPALAHRLDVDRLQLVDLHVGPVVAQLRGRALVEDEGARARVCGSPITSMTYGEVSSVPSTEMPPTASSNEVWATTRTWPLNCIASAPADAELLDRVEHRVDVDRAGLLGDGDPDARAGDRHQAGQDVEGVGLLLGLLERRARLARVGLQVPLVLLEPGDLGPRALRGAGQAGEHVDQVLLAQAGVAVVDVVGAHLDDGGEADHGEQHRDHDLVASRVQQRGAAAGRGR